MAEESLTCSQPSQEDDTSSSEGDYSYLTEKRELYTAVVEEDIPEIERILDAYRQVFQEYQGRSNDDMQSLVIIGAEYDVVFEKCLYRAVWHNKPRALDTLISKGLEYENFWRTEFYDKQIASGKLLKEALRYNADTGVVNVLLENDPNLIENMPIVKMCLWDKRLDVIKWYLTEVDPLDFKIPTDRGVAYLSEAIDAGYPEAVFYFLERGLKLDDMSYRKDSSLLDFAYRRSSPECYEPLVRNGAMLPKIDDCYFKYSDTLQHNQEIKKMRILLFQEQQPLFFCDLYIPPFLLVSGVLQEILPYALVNILIVECTIQESRKSSFRGQITARSVQIVIARSTLFSD